MSKRCKVASLICVIDMVCFLLLDGLKVEIHSELGQAIGVLILSIPFWILLYLLGKEKQIPKHYSMFAKIGLKFWVLCYVIVAIGKMIALLM